MVARPAIIMSDSLTTTRAQPNCQQQAVTRAGVLRRGLSRIDAAAYIGVSLRKFDELVADGRMPAARRIDGRKVWDVRELDLSFDELPRDDIPRNLNTWDDA
jgi:excisionase family DNA binding protein